MGIPIILTENCIAESDDTCRVAYTPVALMGLRDTLDAGIAIRGY